MREAATTYAYSRLSRISEAKNSLVRDLLSGVVLDEAALIERARVLGFDITRQNAVVIINAADQILGDDFSQSSAGYSNGAVRERLVRLTELIEGQVLRNREALWAYIGNGEFAIIGAFGKHDPVSKNPSADISPAVANRSGELAEALLN